MSCSPTLSFGYPMRRSFSNREFFVILTVEIDFPVGRIYRDKNDERVLETE